MEPRVESIPSKSEMLAATRAKESLASAERVPLDLPLCVRGRWNVRQAH